MEVDNYIRRMSKRLRKHPDGFWVSESVRPVSYPEDTRSEYAAIEAKSYWFAHRNRCIVAIARRFTPSGIILDVGGGNGFVSLGLKRAGLPCVVLEPGARGAEIAISRGLPVIMATLADADIADGAVAAIGLFDVLEHIERDLETLNDLHRVLEDHGWLYLTVPAYGWLWSDEDTAAGHARRYTLPVMTRKLLAAGFRIAYATYMFKPLVLPIMLFRSMPSLFRRHRAKTRDIAADHTLPAGTAGQLFNAMLNAEYASIARGRCVSFGSSILVAARKLPRRAQQSPVRDGP